MFQNNREGFQKSMMQASTALAERFAAVGQFDLFLKKTSAQTADVIIKE